MTDVLDAERTDDMALFIAAWTAVRRVGSRKNPSRPTSAWEAPHEENELSELLSSEVGIICGDGLA